uniref:MMS1_N domain-containing protein n=1 Tax=Panagrellus redivivus TaxID=6233 RepID=A0A7E4WBC5_PANRE
MVKFIIELSATSTFKFNDYLKVKKVGPQEKSLTLRMGADKINSEDTLLQSDAECVKIFSLDSTLIYVPNSNMASGLDGNDEGTHFLSVASLDRQHKNGFLVTKLAPNCDWVFIVSKGALKCI